MLNAALHDDPTESHGVVTGVADFGSDAGILAAQLLDDVPHALMLGDETQTVRFANARARQVLAARDGLQLVGRRLAPTAANAARALRCAWLHLADRQDARTPEHARRRWLRIERPSGLPAYQLALDRCAASQSDVGRPVIVVHLFDPANAGAFDLDCLYDLYDLTPGEAEVAVAVAQGRRVSAIARESGRATSTVRNLLKRAMTKTGTSRQHELTALLWRGAAGGLAR
jgi:DNA-binding CsgD family transcriptional regulator